jgi:catechol 2,3-dioxygenase-like lactoylglutathione lyase family enzyme
MSIGVPANPMRSRPRALVLAASAAMALLCCGADGADAPRRPRITGVSHVGLWIRDLGRSRAFYKGYLGFDEPYTLTDKAGGVLITWIKINDRQSLELFPVSADAPVAADSLFHIALETDDAQGMLDYLRSRGVKGPGGKALPAVAKAGRIGNLNYFTEDPDGHIVEFMQYLPDGWTMQEAGRFMPPSRIAERMSHVGMTAGNLEASLRFYEGVLGFTETWRGSSDGKILSWVNLRVPDGRDSIELMLFGAKPSAQQLHILNHFCLEVPDAGAVEDSLKARVLPDGCKAPNPMRTGVNHRRQINCYDPDGTRVEVMEANTTDGRPAPPSDAPPPATGAAGG